jgi:hypothetical protein
VYRDTSIRSIRELDPDTYELISLHLDRYAKISDINTGNNELKTKCKLWHGQMSKTGYGVMKLFGKNAFASRVALQLKMCDDLDSELQCRHKCRNSACVNDDHLEPGTNDDNNIIDKERDGLIYRGERNTSSKITDDIARKIFWSRLDKSLTQKDIAKLFGVTKGIVSQIHCNKSWKHLFTDEDRARFPIKVKKAPHNFTGDEIAKVLDCRNNGIPATRCAKELNLSPRTVGRIYKGTYKTNSNTVWNMTWEEKISKLRKIVAKCDITKESHWLWQGRISPSGYGYSSLKCNPEYVHRITAFIANKLEWGSPLIIRHTCKHKHCVNPDHLEAGTQQDNSDDKIRDGTLLYGDSHPCSTITSEIAAKIKYSKGQGTKIGKGKKIQCFRQYCKQH